MTRPPPPRLGVERDRVEVPLRRARFTLTSAQAEACLLTTHI